MRIVKNEEEIDLTMKIEDIGRIQKILKKNETNVTGPRNKIGNIKPIINEQRKRIEMDELLQIRLSLEIFQ